MPAEPQAKKKKRTKEGGRDAIQIRWERRNIGLFSGGLVAVVVGYVFLSQGDITLAPILLVLGYCVLSPLAFIL
jgi:hypothetical protein